MHVTTVAVGQLYRCSAYHNNLVIRKTVASASGYGFYCFICIREMLCVFEKLEICPFFVVEVDFFTQPT